MHRAKPSRRRPAEPSITTDAYADVPAPRSPGGFVGTEAELRLVAELRAGSETAFASLVDAHSAAMLRVASAYVSSRAVAEEVVQDTWLALLEGLDRFEERSSVKTWLFRVLVNIAKTRSTRERRTVPFSALGGEDAADDEGPTLDPSRFLPADHERWPHHWAQPPTSWADHPELHNLSRETFEVVGGAVRLLPERQRATVVLRDVQGFSADEVCDLLGVSAANQRVLLHRGRARVRQALEDYLDGAR